MRCNTRWRVAGLSRPRPCIARDMVVGETPIACASSLMVGTAFLHAQTLAHFHTNSNPLDCQDRQAIDRLLSRHTARPCRRASLSRGFFSAHRVGDRLSWWDRHLRRSAVRPEYVKYAYYQHHD